jgi:hypothetical protein
MKIIDEFRKTPENSTKIFQNLAQESISTYLFAATFSFLA